MTMAKTVAINTGEFRLLQKYDDLLGDTEAT